MITNSLPTNYGINVNTWIIASCVPMLKEDTLSIRLNGYIDQEAFINNSAAICIYDIALPAGNYADEASMEAKIVEICNEFSTAVISATPEKSAPILDPEMDIEITEVDPLS